MTKDFRQARWTEPLLSELSRPGRAGHIPALEPELQRWSSGKRFIPDEMLSKDVRLPELSELQVLRHFHRLSQMNFSVESGMYPLGSCTMKYNPKVSEYIASSAAMRDSHPLQPDETAQGLLGIFYELSEALVEITGMKRFALSPAAGAHGEFAGVLMIRKYLLDRGMSARNEILVPDSAHGTNPASAAMAGFRIVKIPSDERGLVSVGALKKAVSDRTAGMMLTVPNTLGLFESDILEISEVVHGAGGLLYYDGANMNALLGKTRPGDMGFDIVHLNLHKTFGTPHGGGGPGAGPVGAAEKLVDYLPVPLVTRDERGYHLDCDVPRTIGRLKGFVGNSAVLLRAYVYIRLLGPDGLDSVSSLAVLAANYLLKRLDSRAFGLAHGANLRRKHEVVVSVRGKTQGSAMKVAKGILDHGVHAPTVYFPLTVPEALMIEPTETETVEDIDEYATVLNQVFAGVEAGTLEAAPTKTTVGKIDEVRASHPLTVKVKW